MTKRFLDALRVGNLAELRVIASEVADDSEYVSIKCYGCGEFVAFTGQRSLITGALSGGDPLVTYAVLCHMETCPVHDVRVPLPKTRLMPQSGDMPISKMWDEKFRAAFAGWRQDNDPPLTYEEWFKQYVETKRPVEG